MGWAIGLCLLFATLWTATVWAEEEYILVGINTSGWIFAPDIQSFHATGKSLGVKTTVVGPNDINLDTFLEAFEQAIEQRPAGMVVIAWAPPVGALIDKAMAAGIPVVTFDSDLPNSQRICFVGSDWNALGKKLAEALVKELNGKGKVAMIGLVGLPNMHTAFQGFQEYMAGYPDITVLGVQDDKGSQEEGARVTAQLLQAHPDLAGIAGFDAIAGDGICTALKDAGLTGKVKVVMNDISPAHLRFLQEDAAQFVLGQKRELFTHYALRVLYDINHPEGVNNIKFTSDDRQINIFPVPDQIFTGFLSVTKENLPLFMGQ